MKLSAVGSVIAAASAALLMMSTACGGGGSAAPAPTSTRLAATVPAATGTTAATAMPSGAIASPTAVASPSQTPVVPTPRVAAATVAAPPTLAPPAPTAIPASGGPAITIRAVGSQFEPVSATLPAGAMITLTFENQDAGVAHDIEIFDPSSAQVVRTNIATGPDTQTIMFTLGGPGRYSFKCALHPTKMYGAFAVQ